MDDAGDLSLRERAYETFTRHLLAGGVRPGQFISQRLMMDVTGLQAGGVRELIPRLEAEGLIKTVPQRAMQIAEVGLDMIREAFQFRMLLEREAVAQFTRTAPDALIAGLVRQHREMAAADAAGDRSAELDALAQSIDWGMHDTFIASLENSIISGAYRVTQIKMRLIKQERFRIDGRIGPVMAEHLHVLEAVERREPEEAAARLVAHITNARDRALAV